MSNRNAEKEPVRSRLYMSLERDESVLVLIKNSLRAARHYQNFFVKRQKGGGLSNKATKPNLSFVERQIGLKEGQQHNPN